jgi:hypothetical protein
MRRVLHDAELRVQMRRDGLVQAAKFSWLETAKRTHAVYQAVSRR